MLGLVLGSGLPSDRAGQASRFFFARSAFFFAFCFSAFRWAFFSAFFLTFPPQQRSGGAVDFPPC